MLSRSFVILFWVALIFGVLYWPKEVFLGSSRSINIFAWGDILEPTVVADFEKTTGIKVNVNFYASNEEMIVKLKATGGEGYDLIIPSDYSVKTLVRDDLLKELDKTQLHFLPQLNPKLLGHHFDPHNLYSIPFEWEVFLLGIDKNYFATHPFIPSWKMIFDPDQISYRITMINDPVQAIYIASFYLYGPVSYISDAELPKVIDLLTTQKKYVNAYADFRGDYFLATKNSAVVLCSSSYLWRTMRKFPFVGYVMPKEGSFISIENICIPKTSQKEHLTYQLINYLYTRASMKTHYDTYGIFPATMDVLQDLEVDEPTFNLISLEGKEFQTLLFTQVVTSQEKLRDAWIQVKTN